MRLMTAEQMMMMMMTVMMLMEKSSPEHIWTGSHLAGTLTAPHTHMHRHTHLLCHMKVLPGLSSRDEEHAVRSVRAFYSPPAAVAASLRPVACPRV